MTQNIIPSTKETNIDGVLVGFVIFLLLFTGVVLYKYNKTVIDIKIKRTLNRNAHVVILSTYGPSVQGSPFYERYVEKAVKFILNPINKVNELIIVGGYTVDPNISQSQAVLNYIKEKYPEFNTATIPVTLDECGITTWQNIKNAKKLMDKEGIAAKKITIFAEDSRKEKIAFFINGLFHKIWADTLTSHKQSIQKSIEPFINNAVNENLDQFKYTDPNMSSSPEWAHFTYVDSEGYLVNKDFQIITVSSGLDQSYIDEEHAKLFGEMKEFLDDSYGRRMLKERLDLWSKTAGFNTVENLVQKGCVEYKEFLK